MLKKTVDINSEIWGNIEKASKICFVTEVYIIMKCLRKYSQQKNVLLVLHFMKIFSQITLKDLDFTFTLVVLWSVFNNLNLVAKRLKNNALIKFLSQNTSKNVFQYSHFTAVTSDILK